MAWETSDRKSRLPADWYKRRLHVLRRDRYTCQIRLPGCLGRANQVDHIVPGDDHRYSNLQAACSACHAQKSTAEGHAAQAARRKAATRAPEKHPGLL